MCNTYTTYIKLQRGGDIIESRIINDKEYRLVTVRGRKKWISSDGSAYNPERFNQKATIHINPDGYPCFGGGVPVHLYVAYGWVDGYFDGAEVDHIDFDRTNYHSDNLRWVTHEENVHHSSNERDSYSVSKIGEKNGRATMSRKEAEDARRLFALGFGTMDVIKQLHPSLSLEERRRIWNKYNRIKTGETWCK